MTDAATSTDPQPDATDPGAIGFLAELRRIEARNPDHPPIGLNATLRDEIVSLGQDPHLAFPLSDFSHVGTRNGRLSLRAQFLGFFGPQGALPLTTTEDTLRWFQGGDDAFVRFTDIFATRFQQLFFRSWSDSHAISQYDHGPGDRFQSFLAAFAGTATPAFQDRGPLPDTLRLPMVPFLTQRVRSPVRLRQMVEQHFEIAAEVEEHVAAWMTFEDDSLAVMGRQGMGIGRDCHLGARVQSIGERIRLYLRFDTLAAYRRFLPGGEDHAVLADLIFWYLGRAFDVEVTLSILASEVAPAVLGQSTELGWMAALQPANDGYDPAGYVRAASYTLDPDAAVQRAA